jgi:hypothetical protein
MEEKFGLRAIKTDKSRVTRSVFVGIEDNHMKLPHAALLENILLHYILVNLGLTFRHACHVFKSIKCAKAMAKYEQVNIEWSGKRI